MGEGLGCQGQSDVEHSQRPVIPSEAKDPV